MRHVLSDLVAVVGCSAALALTAACTSGPAPVVPPDVTAAEPANPAASTVATTASSTAGGVGVDDAFRAKANAACRPYNEYNLANPFLFTGFDPDAPDPTLLPQIGDFFDRNPANHTLSATLTGLGAPARGGTEWQNVLDVVSRSQQLATEQIADGRAADVAASTANVAATRLQNSRVTTAFTAAGFAGAVDLCAALY